MNEITDSLIFKPTGRLVFDVFYKNKIIEHFDEQNLIVDGWKQVHSRLLGGDITGNSVTKIGFGTNGSAPVAGNTVLTGVFSKTVDAVSYPASNLVRFNFSLSSVENNGMGIMEFGLLTTGGTLYARKVRGSALAKTVDISISGTWTITFP